MAAGKGEDVVEEPESSSRFPVNTSLPRFCLSLGAALLLAVSLYGMKRNGAYC